MIIFIVLPNYLCTSKWTLIRSIMRWNMLYVHVWASHGFVLSGCKRLRYIFVTKIPIWINFGGSCNGRCWYILRSFGIFFPVLVCCTKKSLATRATRLGEFPPKGWYFTLDSIIKIAVVAYISELHISTVKVMHWFRQKYIGLRIGRFFL
jgi:hypothetical protein